MARRSSGRSHCAVAGPSHCGVDVHRAQASRAARRSDQIKAAMDDFVDIRSDRQWVSGIGAIMLECVVRLSQPSFSSSARAVAGADEQGSAR